MAAYPFNDLIIEVGISRQRFENPADLPGPKFGAGSITSMNASQNEAVIDVCSLQPDLYCGDCLTGYKYPMA